jgi:hypothetical protein
MFPFTPHTTTPPETLVSGGSLFFLDRLQLLQTITASGQNQVFSFQW